MLLDRTHNGCFQRNSAKAGMGSNTVRKHTLLFKTEHRTTIMKHHVQITSPFIITPVSSDVPPLKGNAGKSVDTKKRHAFKSHVRWLQANTRGTKSSNRSTTILSQREHHTVAAVTVATTTKGGANGSASAWDV
jgi:hypothetical protein